MSLMDLFLLITPILAFGILISGSVRRNRAWSAMVTPLASIIGSGFLVSVPLLASAIGIWAVAAVVGLTTLAFLIGGAIRYNIAFGEPIFQTAKKDSSIVLIEQLSHLVLVGAYFISVAYYLVLLATFALKFLGLSNPTFASIIATVLICMICLIGATKGLAGVERAEKITVSANLAAISALLVGLAIFGVTLPQPYTWTITSADHHSFDWGTLRFLMGLLIIVQGFETTRFMGSLYAPVTRVTAMRNAQIMSSLVYIVFFILMVPLFPYFTSTANVAGFIDVIAHVSPWLPLVVTAGAVASQFSASVADSIGASGLVSATSRGYISPKNAYLVIGAVAVCIIWTTDVILIVSLASRAFALFYAIQCTVAVMIARHRGDTVRSVWFGILALIAFGIAILGIPADA